MGSFAPATRSQVRGRIACDGPSGTGKTFTGLRMASALKTFLDQRNGQQHRIAVINTESGAVEKYLGLAPDGVPWEFDLCTLDNFAPTSYTSKILEAGRAKYDIVLIDSLSHAWAGEGGALELKDKQGGNSFTAWKTITPMHNQMINAILASPCHIIATMRSKTEYVLEADAKGKMVPRKVGMAPVQRAGMEYEFDLYFSMDWSHTATVTKTRCPAMDDRVAVKPDGEFFLPFYEWLMDGVEVPPEHFKTSEEDLKYAAEVNPTIAAAKREQAMASAAAAQAATLQAVQQQLQANGGSGNGNGTTLFTAPANPRKADYSQSIRQGEAEAAREPCSDDQIQQLRSLATDLQIPDQALQGILQKRGANAFSELSKLDAGNLLNALENKRRDQAVDDSLAANPEQPTDNPDAKGDGTPF